MTEKELEELKEECVNVLKLVDETSEKDKEHKNFWTCVYRLTETELNEEEEEWTELDKEMMESVDLSGSLDELIDLEKEINRSIREDLDDDTEILFWQKALKRVTTAKLNRQCRETLVKVYEKSKKDIDFVKKKDDAVEMAMMKRIYWVATTLRNESKMKKTMTTTKTTPAMKNKKTKKLS